MSAKLSLRGYQREAIDRLFRAWSEGMRRPAVVLPTGAGKTVVFADLIRQWRTAPESVGEKGLARISTGPRVIVLVHRDELAGQAMAKIRAANPSLDVGKVKATDNEIYADVMVCSVQTISRSSRLATLMAAQGSAGAVGLIITDECFPAGTLVGGRPIESLRAGDLVPTWNEETGAEELRPVNAVMSRRPESLVRVSLDDGRTITCTPNHPILTTWGWCNAGALPRGASVVSFTHDANAGVHGMRDGVPGVPQRQDRQLAQVGPGVLPGRVPGHLGGPGSVGAYGADEPRTRVQADAGAQSDVPSGRPREGVRRVEGHGPQAPYSGGQRKADAGASTGSRGVSRVAYGVLDHPARRGTAVSLQSGHRAPFDEGVRGGGRGVPLLAGPPRLRPAPGRKTSFSRVAGVQILQPGRDGTYGGVCPDGLVYNIEVDTTHTYLIGDGVVVHNCHHAAARSYQTIYDAFPEARHAGFTATLERGDGVGLGSVWDDVVYSRSPLWMMKHGFLVQPRAFTEDVGTLDLKGVKRSGGDYQAGDLGRALEESEVASLLPAVWREHAEGRPTVAFTPTVATAHQMAEAFRSAGIPADTVSGETPTEERKAVYERFRAGENKVLCNCMVLTEGWDAPWASCVIVARPTRSRSLYMQMVGRVLRPWQGKTDAVVINVAGGGGKISTLIDLAPGEIAEVKEGEGLLDAEEREELEAAAEESARTEIQRRHTLRLREIASLFEASHQAWGTTAGGVMFLAAGEWTYFLWPSKEVSGGWDVCRKPQYRGRWERTEHTGLPVEMAMSWAEAEAEDHGSFSVSRSASWRRGKPSEKQVAYAQRLGITVGDMGKADLNDAISYVVESRALDPFIGVA